jgi:hypothetical protein
MNTSSMVNTMMEFRMEDSRSFYDEDKTAYYAALDAYGKTISCAYKLNAPGKNPLIVIISV